MRIVKIKEDKDVYSCLVCGTKDVEYIVDFTLDRTIKSLDHNRGIINFDICNDCLKQIRLEIEEWV